MNAEKIYMPGHPHACRACGVLQDHLSQRGLCKECGIAAAREANMQLHAKEGPYYDRWSEAQKRYQNWKNKGA